MTALVDSTWYEGIEAAVVAGQARATIPSAAVGNQLFGIALWRGSERTVGSVTCTDESALVPVGDPLYSSAADTSVQFFVLNAISAAGVKAVTCIWDTDAVDGLFTVGQFSGGNSAGFYNAGSLQSASGNSAGPLRVNINPSVAGCTIIALGMSAFATDPAPSGAGFSAIPISDFYAYTNGAFNVDVGASGARDVDMTHGGGAPWFIAALALEPEGGTPGSASGEGAAASTTPAEGSAESITVTLQFTFINENGLPVESATLTFYIWRSPRPTTSTPDQILTDQSVIDGELSMQIAPGALEEGDTIWFLAFGPDGTNLYCSGEIAPVFT